jgi:glutathione S-transferase
MRPVAWDGSVLHLGGDDWAELMIGLRNRTMTITITAFDRSPDGGRGLARDTRISNARARAIAWIFAALNTMEPPILELANAKILESDKPWHQARLPLVEDRVRDRLGQLSVRLGDAGWLDGAFSAGDLMMVSVLLRVKSSGMLNDYPTLAAYLARGENRPAYQRAFAAQLAVNTGHGS